MPDLMSAGDIAFPHLGIYLENVPRGFSVFGFTIALYGVIIAFGMMLSVMLASYDRKTRGMPEEHVWDCALYGIPSGIIGARIYYVVFNWEGYRDNVLSVFNLRQGGLAIFGGVLGALLSVYIYARIKKVSFLELFDSIALAFPLGQLIGRWGNFFNREVFGGYTDNLLAMRLPIEAVRARDITPALAETIIEGTNYIQVHPTFLYESLWNLCLLAFLFLMRKRKSFSGEILCFYISGYSLGRLWIEYIRTDRLYIGNTGIPVSMAVSVLMILAAVVIAMRQKKKGEAAKMWLVEANTGTEIKAEARPETKEEAGVEGETKAEAEVGAEVEEKSGPEEGGTEPEEKPEEEK
ncbi:MAG: prolipoprotein diacylglyceryl transferase [Lachnospiraceae bacterium]|nr:prolipoprotein diacylglyceryl transferase [Lachnospiraceae bacterium]